MTIPYVPPINDPYYGLTPPRSTHPMVVPDEMVPPIRGVTSFMSSVNRAGDWIVPRLFRAVAVWGEVKIDLTNARFGAGVTKIELMVIMGNVTILVPPDVRVECDGDPVLASFEVKGGRYAAPTLDSPVVHVSGTAFMGAVEVKIINPNAPTWVERMRARLSPGRTPRAELAHDHDHDRDEDDD